MDGDRRIYRNGAVAITGRRITDVGPSAQLTRRFAARKAIDAKEAPTHPGFVEAHTHVTLHTTRGAFPDAPGIYKYFDHYARWMNELQPEDEYASTLLGSLEMLLSGVTCFMDAGTIFDPDAAAEAAEKVGIRASLADCYLWDLETSPRFHRLDRAPASRDRAMQLLGQQLGRNRNPDALVRGHVAIFGVGTASDELALAAKACADDNGAIFTQQQSFETDDIAADDERLGRHAMVHFADIGLLGPNATFAVVNAVRGDEVQPIIDAGLSLAWNPANYMYYGVGVAHSARMAELHRLGVPIGLASDVAKTWGYGEQGFIGYLVAREQGDYLPPESILEMATVHGARAMGLSEEIGSLEPGKRADVVIRTKDVPEARPGLNVVRQLALVSRGRSISTVIVDGEVVVENGQATKISNEEVFSLASRSAEGMAKRVGLTVASAWPLTE
jgi:5-methylthioadenosine/S-adenosylhomocysteine deaminase